MSRISQLVSVSGKVGNRTSRNHGLTVRPSVWRLKMTVASTADPRPPGGGLSSFWSMAANQPGETMAMTRSAVYANQMRAAELKLREIAEANLKRRKPDFSESNYGFRAFGNLLEEAQARGLLEFGRDEKSGAYVYRSAGPAPRSEPVAAEVPQFDAPQARPDMPAAAHRK